MSHKQHFWDPDFHSTFPGFEPLIPFWEKARKTYPKQINWPTIKEYNGLISLSYDPQFFEIQGLSFIEQSQQARYEQEIYQRRRIPTRLANWHDFFNNLSWLCWPRLKWALVEKSFETNQNKERTPLQNALAHFDECGMVICSDDEAIFERIRKFQWKNLFCETPQLVEHCLPVMVGHGLFEKALAPYIGMTAKALFLKVDPQFFAIDTVEQMRHVDRSIAEYLLNERSFCSPRSLHPFPLLGWPKWYGGQDGAFYENEDYFRVK